MSTAPIEHPNGLPGTGRINLRVQRPGGVSAIILNDLPVPDWMDIDVVHGATIEATCSEGSRQTFDVEILAVRQLCRAFGAPPRMLAVLLTKNQSSTIDRDSTVSVVRLGPPLDKPALAVRAELAFAEPPSQ